ncbi:MAG: hypothetical protein K0R99_3907 [Microbacterium sp.]|jgi:hypothetical protein|nr:hypothetical protein [Microbacterium sp.]
MSIAKMVDKTKDPSFFELQSSGAGQTSADVLMELFYDGAR